MYPAAVFAVHFLIDFCNWTRLRIGQRWSGRVIYASALGLEVWLISVVVDILYSSLMLHLWARRRFPARWWSICRSFMAYRPSIALPFRYRWRLIVSRWPAVERRTLWPRVSLRNSLCGGRLADGRWRLLKTIGRRAIWGRSVFNATPGPMTLLWNVWPEND